MRPGEQQQLAVTAIWSDGRREDVTATAQFDALNDSVAAVTPRRARHREGEGRDARHDPLRRAGDRRAGHAAVREAREVPRVRGEQLHRREARREVEGPGPHAVAAGERRRVPAPALPRRDRHAADAGRDSHVPRGHRPEEAREGHRQGSGTRRVHRLVGAQVGRPAAHQPHGAPGKGHVELPQLGAGAGSRQRAGRRVRPRHRDRRRQHVHRRSGELLPDRPQRPTNGPRPPRNCSSASASAARSATTTRSRSGARTTTTACRAFFSRIGTKNSQEFGIFGRGDGHLHQGGRRGDAPAQARS